VVGDATNGSQAAPTQPVLPPFCGDLLPSSYRSLGVVSVVEVEKAGAKHSLDISVQTASIEHKHPVNTGQVAPLKSIQSASLSTDTSAILSQWIWPYHEEAAGIDPELARSGALLKSVIEIEVGLAGVGCIRSIVGQIGIAVVYERLGTSTVELI
jgi:hypothetical protein